MKPVRVRRIGDGRVEIMLVIVQEAAENSLRHDPVGVKLIIKETLLNDLAESIDERDFGTIIIIDESSERAKLIDRLIEICKQDEKDDCKGD